MKEIELPDGTIAEFPADMPDEQIAAVLRRQFGKPEPAPQQSFLDSLKQAAKPEQGIFRGMRDVVDAGAQMLVRGANAVGIAPESEVARVDQINREAEQAYQQSRARPRESSRSLSDLVTGKQEEPGFDALRLFGNVLGTAPVFAAAPVGGGLAAKTALGAATGAGFGALQPVEQPGDNFWSQKLDQAKTGAIAGAVAAPLTAALARIVQPKTSPDVRKLMSEGVTPTPGQILGGTFRSAEEKAKSIPVVGGMIRNAETRATEQLNRTAVNRALSPLGKELPKGVTGREAVEFAERTLGQSYDDVLAKVGAPKVDNQMLGELANLRSIVANQPKEFAERLDRIIANEILDRTQNGRLTGEAIKKAESNLGNLAKALQRSDDFDKRTLGEAVDETQRIVRAWLERAAPKSVSDQLKATNSGWANFKRVQRAASSLGAEEGVFNAAQLQNAVKALDRSKDKGAFARGSALMQDLSEPAKNVLAQKLPNSGTADRLLPFGAGAAAFAEPSLAAATLLSGGAAYSRPGQAALAGLLARRPELAKPLAEGVRTAGVPILTGGLFGLLSQ